MRKIDKKGNISEDFTQRRSTIEVERFHQLHSPRKNIALHSLPVLASRAAEKLARTCKMELAKDAELKQNKIERAKRSLDEDTHDEKRITRSEKRAAKKKKEA